MSAFSLIDTFFIGRLGAKELAAIGFTYPIILLINSVTLGIGVGASAVISRAIGKGNQYNVRRLTTDVLFLALLIAVFFAVVGSLTIEPLFRLLGANAALIHLIKSYMRIWYMGIPFVVIPMVGNSAIRATGDTKTPALIMINAITVNFIFDPLLIFGIGPFPRLRLTGAATATVFARFTTLIVAFSVVYFKYKMITFIKPKMNEVINSWRKILYIGLPTALTNIIMPVSIGVITRLIAEYGVEYVAGFGVGSRIEMFAMTIIGALSSVLIPFVGQNWGAGKGDRVQSAVKYSNIFSLIWGFIAFITFLFTSKPIALIFNKNPVVVSTISLYLLIVSSTYGFYAILRLSSSVLNALNKPIPSAVLIILRMFVLYVPLAFLGSHFFKIKGIFISAAISNIISGILAYFYLQSQIK